MKKELERILKGLRGRIEAKISVEQNLKSLELELEHLIEQLNKGETK